MRIIIYAICCFFVLPAWADEPSEKQKIIIETIDATNLNSVMDQTLVAVTQAILREAKKKNPNISEKFIQIVTETLKEEMRPLKLEVVSFMVSFMSKEFSIEELQVILNYNKTIAGQKALALMPQMMAQLQVKIQQTMPEIMHNFERSLKNKLKYKKKNES